MSNYLIIIIIILLILVFLYLSNPVKEYFSDKNTFAFALSKNCFYNPNFTQELKLTYHDIKNQPSMGFEKTKVILTAFKDLKCPDCKLFSDHVFPKIKKKYIDTNLIQYVQIIIPMLAGSRNSALAAQCVYHQNTDLYFPFTRKMFQYQQKENENWMTPNAIIEIASTVPGINLDSLRNCIITCKYSSNVNKNMELAHRVMGYGFNTPTLFVNSVKLTKFDYETVAAAIDKELMKCKGHY
jgi:protein-disulfide isomerase